MHPDVSIVVCTYNRASMLRDALASLQRLDTAGSFTYEIVVIDNASKDETPEVIRQAAAASPVELRGAVESRGGVSHARNRGVAEARGRWIAFFDDDQLADRAWLRELLSMAERMDADVVGGAVQLKLPEGCQRDLAPMCRGLLGETVGMDAPRRYNRRCAPGAGNWMIHRDVFDTVGLFDPALAAAGEDTDLFRRMRAAGIDAWYTPKAIVWHCIPSQRLDPKHLEWTALRIGSHVADREWRDCGRWMFPWICLGRMAQWSLAGGLRLARSRWRGDDEARLGARCQLAMAEGYVRYGVHLMSPKRFSQQEFLARLEFRAQR